jgi:predicted transcriptional regulator
LPLREIASELPDRTVSAILQRVSYLGGLGRLEIVESQAWTEREDALLCRLRTQNKSLKEIAPRLPHRTRTAINNRLSQLMQEGRIERQRGTGARRHSWTPQEERVLVRLRAEEATIEEMARELPHRTPAAIALRLADLIALDAVEALSPGSHSRRSWSVKEDAQVERMRRAGKSLEEMAQALGRSPKSVKARITQRVRTGELPRVGRRPGKG